MSTPTPSRGVYRAGVTALLAALWSACSQAPPCLTQRATPARTLMVGNSFTFWNRGLWFPLQDMLGGKERGVMVRPSVQGGASLATHAARERLNRQLEEGDYDLVILQGDIPESTVEAFEENARTLIQRSRDSGAEPLLFMAWDYQRLGWLTLREIIAAHQRVADDSGVMLAPVGAAFLLARDRRQDLDLYDADREHPSVLGSYLALIILHATITGTDPRANTEMPGVFRRVRDDDARDLRQIAWQAIHDEHNRTQD